MCTCGAELGPQNETGLCRKCSTRRALMKPVPNDFAEFAATLTNADLGEKYGAGKKLISRWRREASVPASHKGGGVMRPLPPAFTDIAPTMTRNGLRLHFGCSLDTVDRWCRVAGVRAARAAPQRFVGRKANPSKPHSAPDSSPASRAADYLRRFGPVIRCDDAGVFDSSGGHWRRGSAILGPQDVIDRASRLGWAA